MTRTVLHFPVVKAKVDRMVTFCEFAIAEVVHVINAEIIRSVVFLDHIDLSNGYEFAVLGCLGLADANVVDVVFGVKLRRCGAPEFLLQVEYLARPFDLELPQLFVCLHPICSLISIQGQGVFHFLVNEGEIISRAIRCSLVLLSLSLLIQLFIVHCPQVQQPV